MVTAVTVLALAHGVTWPFIVALVAAAATGAVLGDCLAYLLGSKIPLKRIPFLRRPKAQAALGFTHRVFAHRGSMLILTGRFVPVGRIVVNMTAGAIGFTFRRFVPLAALAGVLWASLAAVMGVLANHVLDDRPLLAIVTGVFLGIGWLFDIRSPAIGYLTVFPALMLAGLMLGALGLLLSSFIRQLENFAGVMNFIIFPMFFASSALYPLWRMRESSLLLYQISSANPFTHAVELIRFALYGQVEPTALAWTCLWTAGFLLVALYGYNPARGFMARTGKGG